MKDNAVKRSSVKRAVKFWLASTKDNLKAAEAMLKSGRWSLCMFMCQQTVEALLKGVYVIEKEDRPPYIHILPEIVDRIGFELPKEIDRYIVLINAHYIKARYHEVRFNQKVYNKENAIETIRMTEEVIKWFTQKMNLSP